MVSVQFSAAMFTVNCQVLDQELLSVPEMFQDLNVLSDSQEQHTARQAVYYTIAN